MDVDGDISCSEDSLDDKSIETTYNYIKNNPRMTTEF